MKISVLTPSFNSGKYIQRAIESVLKQGYPNFEHIVIDAGSQDNTIEILKSFPHIKWISEKDRGQSDAMNKAFNLASGEIIVYLNADDYFLPNAFNAVINEFKMDDKIDVVIGNLYILKNDNPKPQTPSIELIKIIKYWNYKFPLNPVAYFYKKHVQAKIGPFPIENHYSMDYWFILRLFDGYKLSKIDSYLGVFDLHHMTKSSNNKGLDSLFIETKKFLYSKKSSSLILNFYLSFYLFRYKRIYKRFRNYLKS